MRSLSLRPYHGEILLCESATEMRKQYRRLTRQAYPYEDSEHSGRFVLLDRGSLADRVWLVRAVSPETLAHEFAHVLLHTFKAIGHDPRDGDGEPFCYMLSQLMLEAVA